MSDDGGHLLCVQMPFVEADRTVQPDGVVQAQRGNRSVIDGLGMVSKRHVDQQVVTCVGEHGAVKGGAIADVAR